MDSIFDSIFESIFEDILQEQFNSDIKLHKLNSDSQSDDHTTEHSEHEGHITLTGVQDVTDNKKENEEELTVTTESQNKSPERLIQTEDTKQT